MRSRLIVLVVAILLVAAFVALNWSEVMRTSPLSFGLVVAEASLGAILLSLLVLAVVAFVLSAGAIRTSALLDSRHHFKELEAQRVLADNAEASRFTELRAFLDEHLREMRERDTMRTAELQRELRAQSETTNRMLAARLNELEHRTEARFQSAGLGSGSAVLPPVTRSEAAQAVREGEQATAEEARLAQVRDEERLREERIRAASELRPDAPPAATPDRPNEQAGWRRWF